MPNSRSLSVQSKLIAAFVALTLTAIAVMSWIGYASARDSLRAASERELVGLQRSKSALVQTILKSARNEALSLSASEAVTNAARELLPAYRQLGREPVTAEMQAEVRRFYREEFRPALMKRAAIEPPENSLLPTTPTGWYLHYHYIATGPKPYGQRRANHSATDKSAYGEAAARTATHLQGVVNLLDQGNITLVDPETLDVFFSLEQTSVLGTNLINGPYAASKMSKLVNSLRNSQNEDDYKVADFEAYYPSLGDPKAFVATPVFDGPRMIAIMVLKLPIEPISSALSGNQQWQAEGLGKSGEVYLVGPDHDDAERFPVPDRGPGGVPRDIAAVGPHEPHSRYRRKARHDDPGRPRGGRRRQGSASGRIGPDGNQRLPWYSGLDGVRARRPGLVAMGRRREDRRGRGDGAAR